MPESHTFSFLDLSYAWGCGEEVRGNRCGHQDHGDRIGPLLQGCCIISPHTLSQINTNGGDGFFWISIDIKWGMSIQAVSN